MGLADFFSDMISSLSFPEAQAEAPAAETVEQTSQEAESEDKPAESEEKTEEQSTESSEDSGEETPAEESSEEGQEEPEEEEEPAEEEEEEEEEAVDVKPKLEEECAHEAQCAPYKHHYDECVERVTRQEENPDHKGPKEDCVEEFFHLAHCATNCAAPKLWKALK